MSDVNDFLSMTPSEVPESVTLPEGSYDFTITSYRSDKVGENQTPLVRINCKAVGVIQSDLGESDLVNAEQLVLSSGLRLKQCNKTILHCL